MLLSAASLQFFIPMGDDSNHLKVDVCALRGVGSFWREGFILEVPVCALSGQIGLSSPRGPRKSRASWGLSHHFLCKLPASRLHSTLHFGLGNHGLGLFYVLQQWRKGKKNSGCRGSILSNGQCNLVLLASHNGDASIMDHIENFLPCRRRSLLCWWQ
jgi:hypothetical protein